MTPPGRGLFPGERFRKGPLHNPDKGALPEALRALLHSGAMEGGGVPSGADPAAAAEALLAGGLVILPTETVYGLAGRADDPAAVARIYAAKGRPHDHPVIVHLGHPDSALNVDAEGAWVASVPDYARALADDLWPGPMTLVLPRSARATDGITGGQDTVAIRVPAHPVAQQVLTEMDARDPDGAPHGLAAPSANRFGRVSPTTLSHAMSEIADALDPTRDCALDGGVCGVGVESTIIDCTGEVPRILRPGGVTAGDIERVTGMRPEAGGGIRVPGALPSHYAPAATIVLAPDGEAAQAYADAAAEAGLPADRIAYLAPGEEPDIEGFSRLAAPSDASEYARVLYSALRTADSRDIALLVAVAPPADPDGIATAVIDRLRRASAPRA